MSKSDSTTPPPVAKKEEAKYRAGRDFQMTDKGMIYWKPNGSDGRSHSLVANFNARMVSQLLMDDGQETTRAVRLEVVFNKRLSHITLPAKEFARMEWPIEHVDACASVLWDKKAKEAIQHLSGKLEVHHMYRHTGWREINGQQVYLHAGGGIGAKGAVKVEVQLNPALRNYILPEPKRRKEIVQAVRASMKMLDIAPDRISIPLYAVIWRAPLGNAPFTPILAGPTGTGKTQKAALLQMHYGAKMNAEHLPTNWLSTTNANGALAFEAKDALLVVDDFVPIGNAADVQRLHRDADNLLRGQGNQAGRIRMNADTTVRPSKPPRGMILSTGEDVPGGQSLRARLIVIEMAPGDLNWAALTPCQQDAAEGRYAMAMAGYIKWLAPRMANAEKSLQRAITEYRKTTEAMGNHKRTPDNMANLIQGFYFWLAYATHIKAINPKQRTELWDRACKAFDELIGLQSSQQRTADPAQQFTGLIVSAFAGGRAHLVAPNGGSPEKPAAFGWTRDPEHRRKWLPQGQKIGWIRDSAQKGLDDIYLDPSNSYAIAQTLAKETGQHIPLTMQTLQRRLKQSGVLASTDDSTQRIAIRRMLEGAQRTVLHFYSQSLYPLQDPANPASGTFRTLDATAEIAPQVAETPANPAKCRVPTPGEPEQIKALARHLQGLQGFPGDKRPSRRNRIDKVQKAVQGSVNGTLHNAGNAGDQATPIYQTAAERRAERLKNI